MTAHLQHRPGTAAEQGELGALLRAQTKRIEALAAGALNPQRMLQLALLATRKNSTLQSCSVTSVVAAVLDAARLGLEPDGVQGALVPYKGECAFQPMYRGLAQLAYREGTVEALEAVVAREGDLFRVVQGTTPRIDHEPSLTGESRPAVAYYAVAHLRGRSTFDVMTVADVDAVRAMAPSSRGRASPWDTHYDEMAKKTVIKRLLKKLPTSTRLTAALQHDNELEAETLDMSDERATVPTAAPPPTTPPKLEAPKRGLDLDDLSTQALMADLSSLMTRAGIPADKVARKKAMDELIGKRPESNADLTAAIAKLRAQAQAGGPGAEPVSLPREPGSDDDKGDVGAEVQA